MTSNDLMKHSARTGPMNQENTSKKLTKICSSSVFKFLRADLHKCMPETFANPTRDIMRFSKPDGSGWFSN